jgi:thiosulfate/3-mercaptopyruvate sulfurtransferase
MADIAKRGYRHPQHLVDTTWLADHLMASDVRVVESNEDALLYTAGHIPGAVQIDWARDLNDAMTRDFIGPAHFAALMRWHGIYPETWVIFYGDRFNWWAAYTLWVFWLFGHKRVALLDGGRNKWRLEGRPLVRAVPRYPPADYPTPTRQDERVRATREQVLRGDLPLLDARTPAEYHGELIHLPEYPQYGALRGGHIPGAKNIPWDAALRADGTFKPGPVLAQRYMHQAGWHPRDPVVTYCTLGERASHTWFVLRFLLGFPQVRHYDGSWMEYGNLVGVPVGQ